MCFFLQLEGFLADLGEGSIASADNDVFYGRREELLDAADEDSVDRAAPLVGGLVDEDFDKVACPGSAVGVGVGGVDGDAGEEALHMPHCHICWDCPLVLLIEEPDLYSFIVDRNETRGISVEKLYI